MNQRNPDELDDEWEDEWEDEGPDADDDFDYDEFIDNEFGDRKNQSSFSPLIRFTVIVLLAVIAFGAILPLLGG